MHAKILIVDAIATNRIVLKVKLAAAHYEVLQASNLAEAARLAAVTPPDLVICAADLPDGTAVDLVGLLNTQAQSKRMPVLAVAPGISAAARLGLLEVGVDDVVMDIYHDTLLLARVRSMLRAHNAETEWQIRDDTTRALGLAENRAAFIRTPDVTVVCPTLWHGAKTLATLRPHVVARLNAAVPHTALDSHNHNAVGAPVKNADVFILITDSATADQMLALVSSIRSHAATRHCPILLVYPEDEPILAARALDLGVNALTQSDPDPKEVAIRVRDLMQRKQVADQLRATVRTGLEAAVCDPLTGLHNRRYALPHLARLAERAGIAGRPFALMLADLDHFKQVNDIYGHATGDAVLVETAHRLRENLRAVDLLARVGGEEFLIVLPGVDLGDARRAARRLCRQIGCTPFDTAGDIAPIKVTVSIGLAIGGLSGDAALAVGHPEKAAQVLLDRADKALYAAKVKGRNCVTLSRPAA
ncbi:MULTISPECIES: diguanylate cyclase [Roseobacteraceae]|jgi:two-component system cell cycle response regulator|uniref:diguanylate cyclase n=1 Tax=Pseudosulfitobacter pseudonitzschiae TaxID=1402135 RepID=A0A221K1T1_9RHOB|nr:MULTISPECIES: diguanylate cyclase [Roseobacteraceae]ASM72850.1 response regulator PleD [Pseudosulfitobacter pseudonitzschiae]